MDPVEFLEGWLIDLRCLRRLSPRDYLTAARRHSRDCALNRLEAGYAVVDAEGRALVLDSAATPRVWRAARASHCSNGIRLRVRREHSAQAWVTDAVTELKPPPQPDLQARPHHPC